MAVQQTQILPAPFLGDVSKQYAKDLGALTAAPLDTSQFAPTVAPQTGLQQQATTLAGRRQVLELLNLIFKQQQNLMQVLMPTNNSCHRINNK